MKPTATTDQILIKQETRFMAYWRHVHAATLPVQFRETGTMETYKIQQENLAVPTFRSLHQSTHSGIIILHKKLINLLVSCQNSFVDHHDQKRANAIKQSSQYSIES